MDRNDRDIDEYTASAWSGCKDSRDYWQSDHVGLDRSDSSKMQVMPPCCVSRQNQMIQNGDDGNWQYLWPWTGGVWSYFGFQVLYLCATVLCKYSLSATCQLIVEHTHLVLPPLPHFIMLLLFIYQFAGPTLITRNLWQFIYLRTPKLLFRSAILGRDVLNLISKYSACCYSILRGSKYTSIRVDKFDVCVSRILQIWYREPLRL